MALALLGACVTADDSREEPIGTARSTVVGGRVSPDSENDTVFVVTSGEGAPLRCSGTLVAPNLVVTARHCVLHRRNQHLACTPDGQLADPSDPRGQDLVPEAPQNIVVNYGAERSAFTSVQGIEVLTPNELSVCKRDVAFVVLARSLAPSFVPIRLAPVVLESGFGSAVGATPPTPPRI